MDDNERVLFEQLEELQDEYNSDKSKKLYFALVLFGLIFMISEIIDKEYWGAAGYFIVSFIGAFMFYKELRRRKALVRQIDLTKKMLGIWKR